MGACINEFCFEAPGVAAEGLAALCLPAPLYAVVHKTEEPMVEEFYSFDVALWFFAESRRLGFVPRQKSVTNRTATATIFRRREASSDLAARPAATLTSRSSQRGGPPRLSDTHREGSGTVSL